MNTSIPKNIKRLRQQAGLTQDQLAEKLFVTRQTVSLWENGRTQPDIQTLERIAEVFQVELTEVLYGTASAQSAKETQKQILRRWALGACLLWMTAVGLSLGIMSLYQEAIARYYAMPLIAKVAYYFYWYGLPMVGFVNGGWLAWLLRKWPETGPTAGQRLLCGLLVLLCAVLLVWLGTRKVHFWFLRATVRTCFGVWLLTLLTAGGGWGLLQMFRNNH